MPTTEPIAPAGLIPLSDLDALSDPGSRIILSCERAKVWLQQALDGDQIEQLVELKSQAEAIRVYTVQKQLGHDAELSAAEIVRRAERCIGLAIRKGQEEGRIAKRGYANLRDTGIIPTTTFASKGELCGDGRAPGIYHLADGISHDEFENAVAAAKAEKNLSRANVVRKVKVKGESGGGDRWANLADLAAQGYSSHQIAAQIGVTQGTVSAKAKARGIIIHADVMIGGTRLMNPNRVLREFVRTLEALAPSCELINPKAVEPAVLRESVEIMADAMKALRKLERRLRGALDE